MKKRILYLCVIFLSCCLPVLNAHAQRLMNETKILCGFENGEQGGEPQYCDIASQKCIMCFEPQKTKKNAILTTLTHGLVSKGVQVYKCVGQQASVPKNCAAAINGGLKGDEWTNVLFGLVRVGRKEGQNCIVSNYVIKYSNCYGCTVVQTLTSAFVKAAGKAYDISSQAASILVIICMLIWLSMFALKNVSSFATLEPMKILQEFFVQCFKVILALVIINSGLRTIIDYTLVPIMSVGTDIADTITANISEVISGAKAENINQNQGDGS